MLLGEHHGPGVAREVAARSRRGQGRSRRGLGGGRPKARVNCNLRRLPRARRGPGRDVRTRSGRRRRRRRRESRIVAMDGARRRGINSVDYRAERLRHKWCEEPRHCCRAVSERRRYEKYGPYLRVVGWKIRGRRMRGQDGEARRRALRGVRHERHVSRKPAHVPRPCFAGGDRDHNCGVLRHPQRIGGRGGPLARRPRVTRGLRL
mmetsp:Transcript_19996/g.59598  ORF Transcript_19996/g.59598 Transcript_19996/m.59598 type:complete len:206 (-) Transcript_19996:1855-2472(-)